MRWGAPADLVTMRSKRPFVIVTRKLPDPVETRMMELFSCRLNLDDRPLEKPELIAAVSRADVLVPTVTDRIDAEVLAAASPNLKLIASFGTGIDHVDLAAAQQRGIIVTNTPGVLTEDTADMTMALILAVSRRLAEGERLIRSGGWTGWGPTSMLGHRIWGKRLGILGMGRIGMALARRAKGFGLSVHYHNRRPVPDDVESALEATYWESLDQMLAHMDIISVNCPHTPATYHLLSARRLRLMQPHAILVNTARGEIVDEEELVRLLEIRAIAGAGLDVFEHEPALDPRLRALDNVVLLPHMGSATIEGRLAMGERVIINIKTFADGHRPPDRVLGSML
jgi:glyoxylate reductase